MISRLLFFITVPSAILSLIIGFSLAIMYIGFPAWLNIKLILIALLLDYQISLHRLLKKAKNGMIKYSSTQLRIWNEVPTLFLFAIVFLAIAKNGLSMIYGILGLFLLILLLMAGIKIYRRFRE